MPSPDNPHKRGSIAYRRWEAAWKRNQAGLQAFTPEHFKPEFDRRKKLNAIIQGGTFISPTPDNPLPTITTPDTGSQTFFEDIPLKDMFDDDFWDAVFGPDTDDTPFDHIDVLNVIKGVLVRPTRRA